jgi:hypothetical protein
LAAAYSALELAKRDTEAAGDAVESAGRISPESVAVFASIIVDTNTAAQLLAAAIAALPALEDEHAP